MIRQWWEKQHRLQNKRYLTGTCLEQYCSFLRLTKEFFKGKTVLEIGVGLGIATAELATLVKQLDVLDISNTALDTVANITKYKFINAKYLEEDTYDIVISYIVAQHMSNDDLKIQLKYVLKALKPDGFLAIQFTDGLAHSNNGECIKAQKYGGVVRSLEHIETIIDSIGGTMELVCSRPVTKDAKWYGIHVRRQHV